MKFQTGTLRMLTVTDCIKDRLSHFFHWNDRQGLEQALLIAEAFPIDMDELARWSGVEGMLDKFDSIKAKFQNAQK
jgi:hypothetical protein